MRKKYVQNTLIVSHLSLNREGRWGTTDDFATSFLNFSLFSTALWDLVNSRPVHSLMLPTACWILAQTSSLVIWSMHEMYSILW